MKSSVAVAMTVCVTILLAMPYIHNTVVMQQVGSILVALNKMGNLTGDMPRYTDGVCRLGGIIMIVVGAVAGLRNKTD